MRKAAETPCKQRAFRDPPRTPAGPLPDPFPSNTPATRAAPATTNLEERLERRASKRVGQFRDCAVGPGLPSPPSAGPLRRTGPPVNAVGASAGRRAGAPALAEALPSRLGARRSDESEGKGEIRDSTIAWIPGCATGWRRTDRCLRHEAAIFGSGVCHQAGRLRRIARFDPLWLSTPRASGSKGESCL